MDNCTFYTNATQAISIPCNHVNGSANLIYGTVTYLNYGYKPTPWVGYLFVTLFGLFWVGHVVWAFLLPFRWATGLLIAGCTIECVGWGARIWSDYSWFWEINYGGIWYDNSNSFIAQEVCLVVAPVFFSATNYLILGRLVRRTSGQYSSLHSKSMSILLMIADWVCLLVQAGGGAWAGTASTDAGSNQGAKLMSAGVIVQLIVSIIYSALLGEFMWRWRRDVPVFKQYNPCANWRCGTRRKRVASVGSTPPVLPEDDKTDTATNNQASYQGAEREPRHVSWAVYVLCWTTVLLIIRNIFRSAELLDGWQGPMAVNEKLFCSLDALLMMLLAGTYVGLPADFLTR